MFRSSAQRFRFAAALFVVALLIANSPHHTFADVPPDVANVFTVDSEFDSIDAAPGDGLCADAAGECTLRAAVMEANASAGKDAVILPAGFHEIAISGADEDAGLTGDIDITDDLVISGSGAESTVIDGGSHDRVLHALNGASLLIERVTIQNGTPPVDYDGGGIATDGPLQIHSSKIIDNHVARTPGLSDIVGLGGGVFGSGEIEVSHSYFNGNSAFAGGAINAASNLSIDKSTITENDSLSDGAGVLALRIGEGPDVDEISITRSTVDRNSGGHGLMLVGRSIEVADTSVSDNERMGLFAALTSGGSAMFSKLELSGNGWTGMSLGTSAEGVFELADSRVSGNGAGGIFAAVSKLVVRRSLIAGNVGGGINNAGIVELFNSTVSGNVIDGDGGGIGSSGLVLLFNSTITDNHATGTGGGIFNSCCPATIQNSIVAGNTASTSPDVSGDFDSLGGNLVGDATGAIGFADGVLGDQVGSGVAPVDPVIGPLQDNGGPTATHALLAGSPAIDAGDSSVTGPPLDLVADQRGFDRLTGTAVDVGAYESPDIGPEFLLTTEIDVFELRTSYDPTPQVGAPFGVYTITGYGKNVSTATLTNIAIQVVSVTDGNVVLDCLGGVPAGSDCTVAVPNGQLGDDAVLSPGEEFSMSVRLGLYQPPPFSIDAVGTASAVTP